MILELTYYGKSELILLDLPKRKRYFDSPN